MRRAAVRILLATTVLCVAPAARAQFVSLTRCQSAYPCSLPVGLLYNPEPLIGSSYGNVPAGAGLISLHLDPSKPLQLPVLDLSKVVENQDFARDAARIFVLRYPALKAKPAPAPTPPPEVEPPRI